MLIVAVNIVISSQLLVTSCGLVASDMGVDGGVPCPPCGDVVKFRAGNFHGA